MAPVTGTPADATHPHSPAEILRAAFVLDGVGALPSTL